MQCGKGTSKYSILGFTLVWDVLAFILDECFDVSEKPFSICLYYVLFCIRVVSCPCDKIKANLIGGIFDTHGKEEMCVKGFDGKT